MKNELKEIRYSPPVEEIMANPPRAIVRWGSSLFGIIVLIFLIASWLIKNPYIVTSKTEITTENPPVNLVARVSGIISPIYIVDGQKVTRNEILAMMESTTSLQSVNWISNLLESTSTKDDISAIGDKILPLDPGLGEIQDSYSEYLKAVSEYQAQISIDPLGKNIEALKGEIIVIKQYIRELEKSEDLYRQRVSVEEVKYLRDSSLMAGTAIAKAEFDNSRQSYLTEKIKLQETRLTRFLKISEQKEKEANLVKLIADREEELSSLATEVTSSRLKLAARIEWWKKTYLLVSPINGYVSFNKFWGENQVAKMGETVMTVVPEEKSEIIARAWLSMRGSGKVKQGMDVNIRLDGYPFLEHGMVRGKVRSISKAPVDEQYLVTIELPDGLTTFYGEELEFSQNMTGTAEIIAEDMRIIERILDPFKFFFNKNRSL